MPEDPQLEPELAEAQLIPADGEGAVMEEERLPERQYCVFRAGRERFCLAVLDVEEVVEWPVLTPMPLAPAFLMGIFNLRGGIVPIIDIAFSEGRRADLSPRRVVVAKWAAEASRDEVRLGIAADEVVGTYTTTEPLLTDEAPKDVPHCCGMLRHSATPAAGGSDVAPQDERLALALDLKRVVEVFPVGVI
jgi:chemotaxis signal transduction protein